MCRNIKTLYNFEPPATDDEIEAAAIQFVRKISGYNKPSAANTLAFDAAIGEIKLSSRKFLDSLTTSAPPKNRQDEIEKSTRSNLIRFGKQKHFSRTSKTDRLN